jgi:hypothetical protein
VGENWVVACTLLEIDEAEVLEAEVVDVEGRERGNDLDQDVV